MMYQEALYVFLVWFAGIFISSGIIKLLKRFEKKPEQVTSEKKQKKQKKVPEELQKEIDEMNDRFLDIVGR